mgnify:FL=1
MVGFEALPIVPKRRIEAPAAGDWLDTGADRIAIGKSGAGRAQLRRVIGHALFEAGHRALHARTTALVRRLRGRAPRGPLTPRPP